MWVDGGPYSLLPANVIYDGPPIAIDICGLRNGVVRHLVSREMPPGTYTRLHVHFSGAELQLADGRVFSDRDGSLEMPAGDASGLDLAIQTPMVVKNGHWSRLLLDIDLPRSFVPQGTDDLALASSVSFQPLLHLVRPGQTGEIRGTVSQLDQLGATVPVADATVYFLPSGIEDLNMAAGATGTDADGSFAKVGLHPGIYDIVAVKGGAVVTQGSCLVTRGTYAIAELDLP